ncbi:hypothetical protein J4419_01955 [Candidatus Woesearchaeota archaeon]|nr:hypothetical protein [Candidatus Woesearchaeota archaeon]
MAWWIAAAQFVWDSFRLWLHNLFIGPFSNFDIFWILAPVYISLIITEIFQEKKGTSLGNATSNSVIALWGGVDFLRITMKGVTGFTAIAIGKFAIAVVILLYGVFILTLGIRGSELLKRVARVREVSYAIIIFAPLYYTQVQMSSLYLFGAVAFFPLFYLALHLFDQLLPDPASLKKDRGETGSFAAPMGKQKF